MATVPRHLVDGERVGYHTGVEPNDAATLIIIDRAKDEPKVLLGRRHARHVFLPGKFVFPGGRVDTTDRAMQAAKPLHADIERKLLVNTKFQSGLDAQALALAAIRETFEETGLVIGAKAAAKGGYRQVLGASSCKPGSIPIRRYCSLSLERLPRLGLQGALMRVSFASIATPSSIGWKISFTLTLNLSN